MLFAVAVSASSCLILHFPLGLFCFAVVPGWSNASAMSGDPESSLSSDSGVDLSVLPGWCSLTCFCGLPCTRPHQFLEAVSVLLHGHTSHLEVLKLVSLPVHHGLGNGVVPEFRHKLVPPDVQWVQVQVTVTVPPHTRGADQLVCCHGHALCRMDLPGPTTLVGTRTDYSVGPWTTRLVLHGT
jgi:hypothetical protein